MQLTISRDQKKTNTYNDFVVEARCENWSEREDKLLRKYGAPAISLVLRTTEDKLAAQGNPVETSYLSKKYRAEAPLLLGGRIKYTFRDADDAIAFIDALTAACAAVMPYLLRAESFDGGLEPKTFTLDRTEPSSPVPDSTT